MKKNLKKALITLGTVCMLCMAATACGADSGSGNTAEDTAGSTEASNADTPDAQTTETDDSQRTASSTDNPQTMGTDTKDASSDLDQNSADSQSDAPEDSGRWHVLDPETAGLIDADFEGTVQKIEQGTFYVSEDIAEVFDDGSMVSTGVSPDATVEDSDLLQVIYDDSTCFYIRTIYNGGTSYEDSEAESGDLEQYASVSLKGNIRDDIFYADEVRISKIG